MRFFRATIATIATLALAWTGTAFGSDPHTGRDEPTAISYGYTASLELYTLTQQFPTDTNLQNAYNYTYNAYNEIWTAWNYLFDSALEGWTTQAQYNYEVNLAYQNGYQAYVYAYQAWASDQSPAKTQMHQDVYNMYTYIYLAQQQGPPPTPTIFYHGGTTGSPPVLGNVQVIPIFWGSYWGTPAGAALMGNINSFYDSTLTSTYMGLLAEYSTYDASHNYITRIGNGSRGAECNH
jgi:hypothetical protein